MNTLAELLDASAQNHRHLCPRQVLGVRMGVLAGALLHIELPQTNKHLLTIVETDGCLIDGLMAATHCHPGRRTMRVEDYGKVAATFVNLDTGQAIRITPRRTSRESAPVYAPEARNRWEAQLWGYQRMPSVELLVAHSVRLVMPIELVISQPGLVAVCDRCGEEIINGREFIRDGIRLCRSCSGQGYYHLSHEVSHCELATVYSTARVLNYQTLPD